jgi:hypothetical protein
MRLKYHKRSVVIFASRIIPHAKLCGTDTIFQDESMTLAKNEHGEVRSVSGIILYAKHTVVSKSLGLLEIIKLLQNRVIMPEY